MTPPRCRSDILRDLKPDDRALIFRSGRKQALVKRDNRRRNHTRTNIAGFASKATTDVLLHTIGLYFWRSVETMVKTLYK
jgi:hypothetical protein